MTITSNTPLGAVMLLLCHDTTMWNEGFEYAREPVARVTVDAVTADMLADWIDRTHALDLPNSDWGRSFRYERIDLGPGGATVAEPVARAVLQAAIDGWDGL
jgi:hypothetical protein